MLLLVSPCSSLDSRKDSTSSSLLALGYSWSPILVYITPLFISLLSSSQRFIPEWFFFLSSACRNALHSSTLNWVPDVLEIHWKFGHLAICEMKITKMAWAIMFTSSSLNKRWPLSS